QELSPISPRKVAAWLNPVARTTKTVRTIEQLIKIPCVNALGNNNDLHVHVLMSFAADHGTNDLIFSRLGRDLQDKFLSARLELEVPVRELRAILLADESEAMNGSVPVVGLGFFGRDSELYFFARLESQRGTLLPADLVAAVFVGKDLDHANSILGSALLDRCERQKRGEKHRANGDGDSRWIDAPCRRH